MIQYTSTVRTYCTYLSRLGTLCVQRKTFLCSDVFSSVFDRMALGVILYFIDHPSSPACLSTVVRTVNIEHGPKHIIICIFFPGFVDYRHKCWLRQRMWIMIRHSLLLIAMLCTSKFVSIRGFVVAPRRNDKVIFDRLLGETLPERRRRGVAFCFTASDNNSKQQRKATSTGTGGLRRLPVVKSPMELMDRAQKQSWNVKANR